MGTNTRNINRDNGSGAPETQTGEWGSSPGRRVLHALTSTDGYLPGVDTDGLLFIETPGALTMLETGHRFALADLEKSDPYRDLFEAARGEHQVALEERLETLMICADAFADDLAVRFCKEPAECTCNQAHLHAGGGPFTIDRYGIPADVAGWKGRVKVRISEPDGRTLIWPHDPRAQVDLADTGFDFTGWMEQLIRTARAARDDVDFA